MAASLRSIAVPFERERGGLLVLQCYAKRLIKASPVRVMSVDLAMSAAGPLYPCQLPLSRTPLISSLGPIGDIELQLRPTWYSEGSCMVYHRQASTRCYK